MKIIIGHSKPTLNNCEIKAVSGVLKSGYVASGEATRNFQAGFAKFLKIKYAVAVNSGTSALHLALLALKIKSGCEVIIPSYVCASVLNAVLYTGARPKPVDIDTVDFNLSLGATMAKITKNTKAVILPHMFGKPADLDGFLKLGIPVIENCSHSLGAQYKGRAVGNFGGMSTFSFYATKMIATGYGGMVCSKNRDLISRAEDLINVDERDDYKVRFNYRMPDTAASMGASQLEKLNTFIYRRREIAGFYNKNFKKSKNILIPPDEEKNHIYFRYVIRIKGEAGRIINALNKNGIEAKRPVFKPLHRYLGLDKNGFANTEIVYNSAVSLPIYPNLKKSQAEFIVKTLYRVID